MVVLVVTLGLLFFTGTGAVCFGIIMGAISPVLGERRASAASGILNASSGIGGFRHIERLQWHRRLAAVALDAGTPSLVGRRETVGRVERACTDSLAYLLRGPSDRRFYMLVAWRHIHYAEWQLSGDIDVRHRTVRHRRLSKLWYS